MRGPTNPCEEDGATIVQVVFSIEKVINKSLGEGVNGVNGCEWHQIKTCSTRLKLMMKDGEGFANV